jgi:hypothetical protein
VAEQSEALERQRFGHQVDVAREAFEGERRRVDALAAPLAALVDVQQAELVAERGEPRLRGGVIEPGPAVEDDQREPVGGAGLLDEQGVAVGEPDVYDFASFQSSPIPTSTASGGSRS